MTKPKKRLTRNQKIVADFMSGMTVQTLVTKHLPYRDWYSPKGSLMIQRIIRRYYKKLRPYK